MKLSEIDFSRIPYPSFSKLFRQNNITDLSDLQPVCYDPAKGDYLEHIRHFTIPAPVDEVWHAYLHLHPNDLWTNEMSALGLIYDRNQSNIIYPTDPYESLKVGHVYFINLNIIGSLLQIAVAHQVAEVDPQEKYLKVCYLHCGKTEGSQWLKLKENGPSQTVVEHLTRYRGTSFIRDRIFYPFFHSKAIRLFHGKVLSHFERKN